LLSVADDKLNPPELGAGLVDIDDDDGVKENVDGDG